MIRALALVVCLLALISCGEDSTSVPDDAFDLTGNWSATITVTGGQQMPAGTEFSANMVLTQTGSSVTGQSIAEGGLTAGIVGTISGSLFTFTLNQNPPCPGTFTGSGTIATSGDRLSASYSGSDCNGSLEADLTADRIELAEDVIFPLSVGNYWVYVDSFIRGDVVDVDSSRFEITGTTSVTLDGESYSAYYGSSYDMSTHQPLEYRWLRRNEPDGLWGLGGMCPTDTLLIRYLVYKFPAQQGDSWQRPLLAYNRNEGTFSVWDTVDVECVGTNELWETPAGVMSCYAYRMLLELPSLSGDPNDGTCEPLGHMIPSRLGHNSMSDTIEITDYVVPGLGYVGYLEKAEDFTLKSLLVWYHLE